MIRLVVFDWDGVLYNSYRVNSEALDEMLAHFGMSPFGEANWSKLYEADYMALYRKLGLNKSHEEIWKVYEEKLRQKPFASLFPYVEDTLRWLSERKINTVILSLAIGAVISDALEANNLGQYVSRIYADIQHEEKTDILKSLVASFAPKPQEVIYVDDHPHFIREAKKTGCITMAALHGSYHDREELLLTNSDYPISGIDSVQRYINYLNRKQSGKLK